MRFLISILVVCIAAAILISSGDAVAYEQYLNPTTEEGNCKTCHGNFTDATSTKGSVFPSSDKHVMHNGNSYMDADCDLCHTNGDNRNPFIGSSNGTNDNTGYGCMGCHGRAEDAGNDPGKLGFGAGLRQHHDNNGVATCAICHGDADPATYTPVGEHVNPPYYGTVDTGAANACNPLQASNTNENWTIGDFQGLDNDGDLLYDDAADLDCALVTDRPNADITGFADASGDSVPDLATFEDQGGQPTAQLWSGANGASLGSISFLNPDWQGVAIDTIDDGNGDGTADDPAVAMVLHSTVTGKILVHARHATTGVTIAKINFLSSDWTPVDVVVLNDTNGDGNTNDASIGVLAVNPATGKILVQVRTLSTGAKIATRSFLNFAWTPIAAAAVVRAGQTPLLGVLGVEDATNKILVQTRQLSDGVLQNNARFFNTSAWRAADLAAVKDGNSDGTADDPGWLVLARDNVTNKLLVQARFAATGVKISNIRYLTTDYLGQRLATSPDISGNSREEASVLGLRLSDDRRIIQIRDFQTGGRTANIIY